jgi:hypothetical protein
MEKAYTGANYSVSSENRLNLLKFIIMSFFERFAGLTNPSGGPRA